MMKCITGLITILVIFILFYLAFPQNAYAYLEPGASSYILQLIIGALLGGLFTIKLFWNKIKTFFKDLFSGK